MATDGDLQRALGELEGRVGALEEQNRALIHELRNMSAELANVNRTLAEARGGWRMLMVVGGAGAALGGLLASFLALLRG